MSCPCEESRGSGSQGSGEKLRRSSGGGQQEIEDPLCTANNPRVITYEQVKDAKKALEGGIKKTDLFRSRISDMVGINIYLKCEFLQHTGSFKERGGRYAILSLPEDQRKNGVYAASAGNHALAMCYHGKQLGVSVTVVMPTIAPLMKIERCKSFGATVIVTGSNLQEAKKHAMKLAKDKGGAYINGYDHPDILAGAGSIAIEILEQLPIANAIIVPVGGGGLVAGISVAVKTLKPCTKVIGVESEACPSFSNSLKVGKAVMVDTTATLADGLAVPLPGYNSVETAKKYIDKMLVVKEDDIAVSILRLIENEKFVVEGAGATGLAAVLSGQLNEFKGKNIVVILSGGNIDTTVLGRVLERGLAADGRLIKVYVTISDKCGSVNQLCKLIDSIDQVSIRAPIANILNDDSLQADQAPSSANGVEAYKSPEGFRGYHKARENPKRAKQKRKTMKSCIPTSTPVKTALEVDARKRQAKLNDDSTDNSEDEGQDIDEDTTDENDNIATAKEDEVQAQIRLNR
ncbi:threonine dehydratase mitochondrial-related [Holotrichia oblita]|uniref:Threonine dehydratase mitochondrial-related n=2 Tax=Holotrichia oblita TaxID=644536 RepID=A0ACB9SSX2_HOLOL|nr:threonine dehydratase mitochondrial-related [Holotrichia oblita]KAI4457584.1 threonine dehydratase mitochondrial-related [Holotrichia oblita]